MNTGFCNHPPESILENYAMGRLCEQDRAALEEHLLVCLDCQGRLDQVDEFIRVFQAAAASLLKKPAGGSPPVRGSGSPTRARSGRVTRSKYSPA